ncbi:MAG: ATP-binding protein [Minisyncoccia bacterium]
MRVPSKQSEAKTSVIAVHIGQILMRIASLYPFLFENGVVMELVQNAIDVNAENIWLWVNLRKRSIVVQDDGDGVTAEEFETTAMQQVGNSTKKKGRLGRYGVGLFSPMGKCEKFTFTSTSKKNTRAYNQWTFVCGEIEKQASDIRIPPEPRPEFQFSRITGKGVPWRTEMRIHKFHSDLRAQRFDADKLTQAIQERFSQAMKRHDVIIHAQVTEDDGSLRSWVIKAKEFRGTKLPSVNKVGKDSGFTDISLYLSPQKKGHKGKVIVGEVDNDFRMDFQTFARSAGSDFISEEAVQILTSGIFEGVITNSKIKLSPDRRSFERNSALAGFCKAIEEWVRETGVAHVEEVKTCRREERFQTLGTRSMRVLEALAHDNPALMELIQSFKVGTHGYQHAETDSRQIGPQDKTSVSTHSAGVEREPSKSGEEPRGSGTPETTHEHHTPFSVAGPRGRRRIEVHGDSMGLQFRFEPLEDSSRLWEFNPNGGVLVFNTRHPQWREAEVGGDKCLMDLMEHGAVFALHLEGTPPAWRVNTEHYLDDLLPSLVFLLLNSDRLAGRRTIVHSSLPKKSEK